MARRIPSKLHIAGIKNWISRRFTTSAFSMQTNYIRGFCQGKMGRMVHGSGVSASRFRVGTIETYRETEISILQYLLYHILHLQCDKVTCRKRNSIINFCKNLQSWWFFFGLSGTLILFSWRIRKIEGGFSLFDSAVWSTKISYQVSTVATAVRARDWFFWKPISNTSKSWFLYPWL